MSNHQPAPSPRLNAELAERYLSVRRTTEQLCAPLSIEDQMVQSMPDASPAKWHQAHTTWFFETFILLPHVAGYEPRDERYPYLYNSYYKQLGGHPVRANRGMMSRPSSSEVQEFRRDVDEHMLALIENGPAEALVPLIELGLNHEQQHQELILTDIKHALWSQPLRPAYRPRPEVAVSGKARAITWLEHDGGREWIGYEGSGFSFDNERPRHEVLLQPFRIASRLVTNGEYLQFMADSGYLRPELWLSDGWDTVCVNGWRAPLYWEQNDGEMWITTLTGERKLNPAEPVCHVSYFEADAYARWAGARLPTEAEWEVIASSASLEGNFLEENRFHPGTTSAKTPTQLFGDAWEWTASPYVPYPGFRAAAGVLGEYNGKFMCNQMVLRGGSCATPRSHIRPSYRNFFPPQARWQFSGIRLAQ